MYIKICEVLGTEPWSSSLYGYGLDY